MRNGVRCDMGPTQTKTSPVTEMPLLIPETRSILHLWAQRLFAVSFLNPKAGEAARKVEIHHEREAAAQKKSKTPDFG
jgi:hypothetical protein